MVSRNEGSGAYYALQILDVAPSGLRSWLYRSVVRPRLEGAAITLGGCRDGYYPMIGPCGDDVAIEYRRYRLTEGGLQGIAP